MPVAWGTEKLQTVFRDQEAHRVSFCIHFRNLKAALKDSNHGN